MVEGCLGLRFGGSATTSEQHIALDAVEIGFPNALTGLFHGRDRLAARIKSQVWPARRGMKLSEQAEVVGQREPRSDPHEAVERQHHLCDSVTRVTVIADEPRLVYLTSGKPQRQLVLLGQVGHL